MLQEMKIGMGRTDAMRAMAERTNSPDLRVVRQRDGPGRRLRHPDRPGAARPVREMRIKRRQRAEEKAQKVPVKILVPLMFCILPCLFIAVIGPAANQHHGHLLQA